MSCVRVTFSTPSHCLWTSASIMQTSSTRSLKWLKDASGSLPRHEQQVGGGHRCPTTRPDRLEAPLVRVAAKVGWHFASVVGQHHRVLVDVDQHRFVHQPLETQLL